MKNLYVGNVSHSTTEAELRSAFEVHGAVDKVSMVTDRDTGRSRGFAFVEMTNAAEADKAIAALDGAELGGRALKVNEAKPKTSSVVVADDDSAEAVVVDATIIVDMHVSPESLAGSSFAPQLRHIQPGSTDEGEGEWLDEQALRSDRKNRQDNNINVTRRNVRASANWRSPLNHWMTPTN